MNEKYTIKMSDLPAKYWDVGETGMNPKGKPRPRHCYMKVKNPKNNRRK